MATDYFAEYTKDEPTNFELGLTALQQQARKEIALALHQFSDPAAAPLAPSQVTFFRERLSRVSAAYFPTSPSGYPSPNPEWSISHDFPDGAHEMLLDSLSKARTQKTLDDLTAGAIGIDEFVRHVEAAGLKDPQTQQFLSDYNAIVQRDTLTAVWRHFQPNRLEDAVRRAEKSAENARIAAGDAGEKKLIGFFESHARSQGIKAALLVTLSLAPISAAVWIAYDVLEAVGNADPAPSVALVTARLALTIPMLGLSAYFARLSAHYREAARWAATAKVQLQTIGAFTDTIDDPVGRDEARRVLSRRIFSSPDFGDGGAGEDFLGQLQAAADIASKLKA